MSIKMGGVTEDGLKRIAETAARQRRRQAAREQALEPARVVYASAADLRRDFEPRGDGTALHRESHRVWEMRAAPNGGFELIRAQGEHVEDEAPPAKHEAGSQVHMSDRLMKAAARGAQYLPGFDVGQGLGLDMPQVAQGKETAQSKETAQGDGEPIGYQDADGFVSCPNCAGIGGLGESVPQGDPIGPEGAGQSCASCGAELGGGAEPEKEGQAPPATIPPAQPPAISTTPTPTTPMSTAPSPLQAGLRDIREQRGDRRLAGITRGTKVLVRAGRRVLRGRVLTRTAASFDVLLDNGATSRVPSKDVAPDGQARDAIGTRAPKTRLAEPAQRTAVDQKAKEYWEGYWKEFGRQLTKTDLPRAVTDRAEPATPKGKQKMPTSVTAGTIVDIGNLWMAGKGMRTGTVEIVAVKGDQLAVRDPFGAKMVVPGKAVVAIKTAAEFTRLRHHGTPANSGRALQAASAALSWRQIAARFPRAAGKLATVRRWIAEGIQIGLAGGDVPAKTASARKGRVRSMMEWRAGRADLVVLLGDKARLLPKLAVDEKSKRYYAAYWGDYGEDLVKEVRRRIRADQCDRQAGRNASPPRRPVVAEMTRVRPAGSPKPASIDVQVARALAAHVNGVLRQAAKDGSYTIGSVKVTASTKDGARRTIKGIFDGRFTAPGRDVKAAQAFELLVESGKVKAVKITNP